MVVIESVIKTNPLGRWYIELSDTMKEESIEICLDIYEYAQKIAMMGEEYGGEVEVAWSTEDNVTPAQINEVRQQIMAYEAEIEAQQDQPAQESTEWTPNA
ncbi:MAG: hypothetical protein WBM70_08490 [Sulfurovum sp.]|uniref:hypothetical protein n=1 Tax=Sulfurovum sp. TaxID=1969726 RepID=UPI003C744967